MTASKIHRLVLTAGLVAVLAGCGGLPSGLPLNHSVAKLTAARPASSATYTQLYAFRAGSDGTWPVAPLVALNGKLYGTTEYGGTGTCNGRAGPARSECGTVFSITPSGKESVIYRFTGRPDGGQAPVAGLTVLGGKLYGVTRDGGTNDYGMAFATTTAGAETTLNSFQLGTGGLPEGALLKGKTLLYGTTVLGGTHGCNKHRGCGTVFSMTASGTVTVIHKFAGAPKDGEYPHSELLDLGGTLYGTTPDGGANGSGTVFSIAPSGAEAVLHSFGGSGDGKYPQAGLIEVNGMLYGTTQGGGTSTGCSSACGTVFAISTDGKESVIHSFDKQDGADPWASLVDVDGILYGTTYAGGANDYGTVFSVTPSGTETVLYSFAGPPDGYHPTAALISVNGTLYGTTTLGGGRKTAAGTVFSLKP